MKFTETSVATAPEILYRKIGGELFEPITIDSSAFTDGVCKAGSPIGADGKVANSSSAVGILLYDVYEENPNGSLIKAFAVVNRTNAEANSGLTLAAAVATALPDIKFEPAIA